MNPDTKLILDEINKKFDEKFGEFESKWGSRFSESEGKLESRLKETEEKLKNQFSEAEERMESRISKADDQWERRFADLSIAQESRVSALERAASSFDDWRPDIEGTMDDIRLEVNKISKNWERALLHPRHPDAPVLPTPVLPTQEASPQVIERPSAQNEASRPYGHHANNFTREDGFGSVSTWIHSPAKGMTIPQPPKSHGFDCSFSQHLRSGSSGELGKLPKLNFPYFEGENPKLWLTRVEDYFELYDVDSSRWVKLATMHMSPIASRWVSSVSSKLKSCSWKDFSKLLLDRFGREHHELLVRQFLNIKQTGSLKDYIDQFSTLVDQLIAYGSETDPLYHTMRFVDGLTEELRSTVLLQRPSDLDTAFVIAQLQEEVSSSPVKKDVKRSGYSFPLRASTGSALPLPQPPKVDKLLVQRSEDHRAAESSRAKSTEDRWKSLRALRRAQGLCQFCAEKWSKGHSCADKIQLHVVQELLEVFQESDEIASEAEPITADSQLFLTLSQAAVTSKPSSRSMCMLGSIQGIPLRILVDSGSSHTFISTILSSQLSGVVQLPTQLNVQVADGKSVPCTSHMPAAVWSMNGLEFTGDLKLLNLGAYDMILGLDWLELFSPMKVHWKHRWMAIPYNGTTTMLYGEQPVFPEGSVVQVCTVEISVEETVEAALPPPVQALLEEFAIIFAVPDGLPPSRDCDHQIPLVEGAAPVQVRPYRFAPALKDEIEKQVKEMLASGVIQKSTSPFSSSVLLVKKKDGSWRFCVDYRHLNAITVKGKYPVPVIDEFLDELAYACWFSKLDLRSGFHQIRLKPGEEFKTAFQTHCGHFEFRVMAFGLTGAPGSFQAAMNSTLAPFLRKFVLVFFDDILIYSKSFEEHIEHLRLVFELLHKDQWFVKLSKCSFAQREISYLGHIISEKGVATDPDKIAAVLNWPVPVNAKELRSFLGLAGYYRKFVRNFGIISKPLTELLKKHAIFVWTVEHDKSFQALKHALCSAPVLAMPDFSKVFSLETDASGSGIGAVVLQQGHPLAFISKALGPRSQGLSTYEKEYMAILMAIQQWRPYLQHAEFEIHTDQRSLVQLNQQRLHTTWQQKVFTKLLGLQYKIIYKQGVENRVADALSRKSSHDSVCFSVSVSSPKWLHDVVEGYWSDAFSSSVVTRLSIDANAVPHFTLKDGLLRYKNRVWIGHNPLLQQKLLLACHSSPVGGHSGVPVTYARMKKLFAWRGMKSAVHSFVRSCLICQQAKPDRSKLPGLLQPLPVPSSAWQVISMDFVEGLPRSGAANCILVVVDSFTKYAHFIPLHHPFTASVVAKTFLNNIYKLHGMPLAIITDRDRIFNSQLWKELFKLAGVDLKMSSSYHPQTDGQTERVNQTMETFLRCFANACPSKWIHWLSLAEFWYNCCPHSATNLSPFVALYGHPPRQFGISEADAVVVPELSSWLQDRQVMNDLIKQHLHRAKLRMKKQADQKRSERSFEVGDMVFLKLQPYVQSSLAPRSNQKLSFKFFGPFKVLERVGLVAYRPELPATSSIHPVFHISQLKKAVAPEVVVIPSVPASIDLPRVPERVLQRRMVSCGNSSSPQVLIKWSGWPAEMSTWEALDDLKRRFPRAPAWGQAGFKGRGSVSNHQSAVKDTLQKEDSPGPAIQPRTRKPNVRLSGPEWL
ncbi:unnamed protein product [Urochloa humidicola]